MLKPVILSALLGLGSNPAHADELRAEFIGASGVELSNPHDLKLSRDGRLLYVSDVGNNRIAILDADSLQLLGEFGADHQSGTHDIDLDDGDRAYVADTHNNRVAIYRLDGLRAERVGELKERIRGPEGVLSHRNGRIYVAGAWSNNLVAYRDGEVLGELNGLSSPHDLEAVDNGDIWLADAGNHRLLLLSPDLAIKRELSRHDYDFNGVRYLDILSDGTLVATDKYNHQIKFIAPDGALLLVLGDGKPGLGPNKFVTPEGADSRGDILWLSDSGNNRVVKYRILNE